MVFFTRLRSRSYRTQAKDALCGKIDDYIRDRIVLADQVIQETATKKIQKNDVVLTYARSSVVEKVLLQAWEDGTPFSVIVVDSRPMLEGIPNHNQTLPNPLSPAPRKAIALGA